MTGERPLGGKLGFEGGHGLKISDYAAKTSAQRSRDGATVKTKR